MENGGKGRNYSEIYIFVIKFELFNKIVYEKTDECYIEWQRVTMNDNDWYNGRQQMTTSENEWQRMTTSGTANENGTVHFKEWMIAILSMIKTDILLQGTDGCN